MIITRLPTTLRVMEEHYYAIDVLVMMNNATRYHLEAEALLERNEARGQHDR